VYGFRCVFFCQSSCTEKLDSHRFILKSVRSAYLPRKGFKIVFFVINLFKVSFLSVSTYNHKYFTAFSAYFVLTNRLDKHSLSSVISVWQLNNNRHSFLKEFELICCVRAPREGVSAGGECDAEAGRDPQLIRHTMTKPKPTCVNTQNDDKTRLMVIFDLHWGAERLCSLFAICTGHIFIIKACIKS